jgi:hypothetical protein
MKSALSITTLEQVLLASESSDAELILQRAHLLEHELLAIIAHVDLALAALEHDDEARIDLLEIRIAAQRAITEISTVSAKARRPQLRAV